MFRYECDTCDKWHGTDLAGAWWSLKNGFSRFGIAIGEKTIPLQPRGTDFQIRKFLDRRAVQK